MSFFGINVLYFLISVFAYFYFRMGVSAYCEVKKMSRSFVKKHTKGYANYWLYRELHRERGLGILYPVNYLFLGGLGIFFVGMLLSLISWMEIPVLILGILLGLVQTVALAVSMAYSNLNDYGSWFVLFRKRRTRGFDSPLNWLGCVAPLLAYAGMYFANT